MKTIISMYRKYKLFQKDLILQKRMSDLYYKTSWASWSQIYLIVNKNVNTLIWDYKTEVCKRYLK